MDSKALSFTNHLTELRTRMIKVLFCIGLGFLLSYFFSKEILALISQPVRPYLTATKGNLIFISPFEKFFSYLWVSLFSGIIFSSPFCFYQIWKFISPGLYKNERKWSLLFCDSQLFAFFIRNFICVLYCVSLFLSLSSKFWRRGGRLPLFKTLPFFFSSNGFCLWIGF